MKENLKHIIKVITGQDYKELKAEWEQQNITIDKLTLERNKEAKKNEKMQQRENELLNENLNLITELDSKTLEIKDLKKKIKDLNNNNQNLTSDIEVANFKIKRLEADLKETEKSRHSSASKNGAYVVRIKELEAQVDFLKTHRRAPSLDEIKDYTLRRKSVNRSDVK